MSALLAWRIALRYLFSKKSHNAVNVISVISVAGVAVATAAIVIVLSVFNGFTKLAQAQLSIFEPDLKVTASSGKVIANADSLAVAIEALSDVEVAIPTLRERALLISGNEQMPVMLYAVADGFDRLSGVDREVIDGAYLTSAFDRPAAQLSVGVAMKTNTHPIPGQTVSLNVPVRVGRINPVNPASSFRSGEFAVTSVVRGNNDDFDSEGVIIPLHEARRILDYASEASAIEVRLRPGAEAKTVAAEITEISPNLQVATRIEQLSEAFRMISIEKWITFLLLVFILIIASFNIISSLSLLVIEKRDNMSTLRALGADRHLCRRIFIIQGWLITTAGGIIGIIIGSALALLQQFTGIIRLNGNPDTLIIDAYPVHVQWLDLLVVFALVALLGLLISQTTRLFAK